MLLVNCQKTSTTLKVTPCGLNDHNHYHNFQVDLLRSDCQRAQVSFLRTTMTGDVCTLAPPDEWSQLSRSDVATILRTIINYLRHQQGIKCFTLTAKVQRQRWLIKSAKDCHFRYNGSDNSGIQWNGCRLFLTPEEREVRRRQRQREVLFG